MQSFSESNIELLQKSDTLLEADLVEVSKPKIDMPQPDFRKRVPALDGLRGIAILSVFFFHYAGGLANHGESRIYRAIGWGIGFGWTGVDLFFVLSGFLITGILYDTIGEKGYFRKFYARRALRIFPIYYLFVAVCLSIAPWAGIHWKPGHLLFLVYLGYPAALLWPSLVSLPVLQFTHLWSLSVEEQFYMIWPWMVARLRNRSTIVMVCWIAALCAISLRLLLHVLGCSPGWSYVLVFCRMDALAVGAAISLLTRGGLPGRIFPWAVWILALASLLIAVISIARHTVDRNDPVIATIGYSLIAIAYGALLVLCLKPYSLLNSLCSLSILRLFGRYSYGLYLYHFPLMALFGPLRGYFVTFMHSFALGGITYLFVALSLNLLVAAASFHLIESPIMKLKDRFRYSTQSH